MTDIKNKNISKSQMKRIAIQQEGLKPYPTWVCTDCGVKASTKGCFKISTFHQGTCDVCEQDKAVTEPRDFYYPKFKGHK